MNGVSLSDKVIHWNPKEFAVSQNFNKVIRENEKVSNDYGVSPKVGWWLYSAICAPGIYAVCKRAILRTDPFTD